MDIFTPPTPKTEPTPIQTTETPIQTTETQAQAPIVPTKPSHIKIIILISLGITLILGVALFFFFKNQDRQNGYYGTYTLNFESKEVGTKTDEYVLTMGGNIPVSVGLNITNINTNNLTQVSYFYADPNNGKIYEERIFSGINNTQYFAIPRNGGEYTVGARLQYKDGNIIKSSDYFSAPLLTIWPDQTNDQIPIASLKTDRTSTSLQEEILFTVITKIKAQDDSDFQKNRQVLRDFDGDGTRDRKSQGTTTRYRYTQSYGILQYEPKVAVVYKGFTGTAIGIPITIK